MNGPGSSLGSPDPFFPGPEAREADVAVLGLAKDADVRLARFRLAVSIWSLAAAAGVVVGLRIHTKRRRRLPVFADDYLVVGSCLSLLGATALYQYLVKLGLGKPMTTLALDDRRSLLILGIIARTLLLNPSTALAKISFASTLMRFSYAERMRQFLWLMIASVSILMVFHVIFPWLACVPFWKRVDDKTDGGCYLAAYDSVVFGSSVFFGLTDIALALLPWRLLFFPELKRWERLGVVVAMSLGAFAGVLAIAESTESWLLGPGDRSLDHVDLTILLVAECTTVIIACSLPILRCLFHSATNPCPCHCRTAAHHRRHRHHHHEHDNQEKARIYLNPGKPPSPPRPGPATGLAITRPMPGTDPIPSVQPPTYTYSAAPRRLAAYQQGGRPDSPTIGVAVATVEQGRDRAQGREPVRDRDPRARSIETTAATWTTTRMPTTTTTTTTTTRMDTRTYSAASSVYEPGPPLPADFRPRPESFYRGIIFDLVADSTEDEDGDDQHAAEAELAMVPCSQARAMRDGVAATGTGTGTGTGTFELVMVPCREARAIRDQQLAGFV